jgi:hypothetical protein
MIARIDGHSDSRGHQQRRKNFRDRDGAHARAEMTRRRVPVASPRRITRSRGVEPHRVIGPYRRSITRQTWSFPAPPALNHGGPLWPVQRHSVGASMLPRPPWPTVRRLDAACALPLDHALGDFALPAPIESWQLAARYFGSSKSAFTSPELGYIE